MDKVSYALGLSIGQNFRASGFDEINLRTSLRPFAPYMRKVSPR